MNNPRRIFTATRNTAIISVLLCTGLRSEELCLVTISDLDLNQSDRILIQRLFFAAGTVVTG
ncbi:MAG: hypothetical protein C4554_02270 [Dethiobacter sp.]|nr:MAG: hypothetical protein C4554_02270 [Dethiobacter sp.]